MRGTASGGRMLWETLGEIPDRRGKKGRQYPLRSVLVLTLAAMLAGANDLRAIFRWGRRLPKEALYLLGIRRAPCHAMYHYFFKALDVAAVEQVLGAWARGAAPPGHVAIDGKRLRGSRPRWQRGRASARRLRQPPGRGDWAVARCPRNQRDHRGVGPAQKSATGRHDHHRRCRVLPARHLPVIRDGGGYYLFTVKANQRALMAYLAVAFGDAFPPGVGQGAGRHGAAAGLGNPAA